MSDNQPYAKPTQSKWLSLFPIETESYRIKEIDSNYLESHSECV